MQIVGVKMLLSKLSMLEAKAARDTMAAVEVSYKTDYCVYVHEDMTAYHKPPTRAKFLEGPAREKKDMIANIVHETTLVTGSLKQGLLAGGLYLQGESQDSTSRHWKTKSKC
jgi:hypothetical protein